MSLLCVVFSFMTASLIECIWDNVTVEDILINSESSESVDWLGY